VEHILGKLLIFGDIWVGAFVDEEAAHFDVMPHRGTLKIISSFTVGSGVGLTSRIVSPSGLLSKGEASFSKNKCWTADRSPSETARKIGEVREMIA